jgi:DNA recombination protein RmuC
MIETSLIVILILCLIIISKLFLVKDSRNSLSQINESVLKFQNSLDKNEKIIYDQLERNRDEINKTSKINREELSKTLNQFEEKFGKNIKDVRETINNQLKDIRDDNTKQLDKMRNTVDEKLQKTLETKIGESFKQVSERLAEVHKGLGEMQTVASGVGDLKKVLANVKTRGVFGEYQLENILEQLLSPEQYAKNVSPKPDSQANVEFAIKLPGKNDDDTVWLPIDSKFPIEPYNELMDAENTADKDQIENARKHLVRSIDTFAKDISSKYIVPPYTTDFAIMFLPIEGLFAEVLKHPGLMDTLRRKYKITITGPTTLSALLNSLQMGFRTLVVQKRSSEVWKILEAVKTEFETFGKQLEQVDKQLNTASKSLGKLRSTRTNAIERKMRDIQVLDKVEADDILQIDDVNDAKDDNIELDFNENN